MLGMTDTVNRFALICVKCLHNKVVPELNSFLCSEQYNGQTFNHNCEEQEEIVFF